MNGWETMGRIFITLGIILLVSGFLFYVLGKFGWRMPGDIFVERENFRFYFPVVTCIVVSVVLTILLNIFGRR